jgi:hypothetical protein
MTSALRLTDAVKLSILSGKDADMFEWESGKIAALRFDAIRFEPAWAPSRDFVIVLVWNGRDVASMSAANFGRGDTLTLSGIKANIKLELTQ